MWYRKSIRSWEQWVRVSAGIAMVACGFLGLPGNPVGLMIAAAGLFTALTGVVGYCPACALAGRRLEEHRS